MQLPYSVSRAGTYSVYDDADNDGNPRCITLTIVEYAMTVIVGEQPFYN